jgi:hypothetical protein
MYSWRENTLTHLGAAIVFADKARLAVEKILIMQKFPPYICICTPLDFLKTLILNKIEQCTRVHGGAMF